MAVQIPAQAIADAGAAGELKELVLAIAGRESTWNPNAKGDWKMYKGGPLVPNGTPGAQPYSLGYLQFYTDGGLGNGHSTANLLNGVYNMRLGAEYIRSRLAKGASLYQALSPWSTRESAWALYQRIRAEGITPVGSAVTPSPDPGPIGNSGALVLVAALGLLLLILD